MTRALLILTSNSWREQVRGPFFSVTVIFGAIILYVSTLLGLLAADQEVRVLMDFGLSFIEIIAALAVAYTAATGLLQELQTKTIYLVLSRPVPKSLYLLGRYFGLLASSFCSIAAMAAVHLLILRMKGWQWDPAYAAALSGILLKIMVTASLATFLALISTSALSALVMTGVSWMLGHFVTEIRFLLEASRSFPVKLGLVFVHLVPNFQLFNFRDRMGIASAAGEPLWQAVLYAPAYAAVCLCATLVLFRRKEF